MPTKRLSSRRDFIKSTSLLTAGSFAFPQILRSSQSQPPARKLNLGFVGAGGKGLDPIRGLVGHNYVAFCDVDEVMATEAYKTFPQVPRYKDFRRMLDRHAKEMDAVLVCTPDHTHFHPVVASLQRKLHVFVEKPLASSIWEARLMQQAAQRSGCFTQMGIQGHSFSGLRVLREWLDSGVIGDVQKVYLWTDRPLKRDLHDFETDAPEETSPATLDWDLWLGPTRQRGYSHHYLPHHWHAWWDFSQCSLGDIGTHMFDVVEYVLDAGYPDLVSNPCAQRLSSVAVPKWSNVDYHFPARGKRPGFTVHWYSGMKTPERQHVPEEIPFWPAGKTKDACGMAFVGKKGMFFIPDMRASSRPELYPEALWEDFRAHLPAPHLERVKGNHFQDWLNAIQNGTRPGADFNYSAPLCEVAFLGNLAIRTGKDIRWDPAKLCAEGVPEAEALIRPAYERKGWEYRI